MEAFIIFGGSICFLSSAFGFNRVNYKFKKRSIRKNLNKSFQSSNIDLIKKSILNSLEFDKKHNTKKTQKYLQDIVFKNNNRFINDKLFKDIINNDDIKLVDDIFKEEEEKVEEEEVDISIEIPKQITQPSINMAKFKEQIRLKEKKLKIRQASKLG